jgi:hypothetical protein
VTQSVLMLHKGAREVTREIVEAVPVPAPEGRWHPLSHGSVLDLVVKRLGVAGFEVARQRLALSRNDQRLFAVLDLASRVSDACGGITLACGVSNSLDKSTAVRIVLGSRVFCCDNLALRGSVLVAKKHTRHVVARFEEAVARVMGELEEFRRAETARIALFREKDLSDARAHSLMLRAFRAEIVSHLLLRRVMKLWEEPEREEFRPRTLFSLENAFTSAFAGVAASNPSRFVAVSLDLQALLGTEIETA